MLSSIKNKIKGWVAYLIVGLITVPFALFGVNQYFTGVSNITVAVIDGEDISKEKFLLKFDPQKRRLQQKLAEKYNEKFDVQLKQSVINQMIDEHLLEQFAIDLGYATTAKELQALIQANTAFSTDGQFSLEKYKQLLRLNGYTATQYENEILTKLTQNQIQSNLANSAFVVPVELDRLGKINSQQRKFKYLTLQASDYAKDIEPKAEKIKAFYKDKQATFFTPEQVKIDFVELSLEKIAKKIKVDDKILLDFYKEEKARFSTDEERQAQHILFKDKSQAEKVLALLDQGGDFSKLATEYSQDTGSKDAGGDLGFFTRGVMVAAFEKKVFSMQTGEISDLVKSEFGYHIIKLTQIKPSTTKPFDMVKVELLDLYTNTKAQKSLYDLTEQLANLAYEASLEEVANQMDLTLQTSDFFSRNNKDLDQKIIRAAFDDAVFNNNENSAVLTLSQDKFRVIRLNEKQPQKQKTLIEVEREIKTLLSMQLAKTLIDNTSEEIINILTKKDEKSIDDFMQKNKLKWSDAGWIDRNSQTVNNAIVNKVFALKKPKNSPIYSAQNLGADQVVVMALSAVRNDTTNNNSAKLENTLLALEANVVFANILSALKLNADIKIYAQNL